MYDYKMKNYTLDIKYLTNRFIYEYDISKANLNILYHEGVVSKKDYDLIMQFGRGQREIYFGNLQRNNKEISEILANGIAKARKAFIEANNLNDMNILSVKNDAIFVIDNKPRVTKFDNIEFKLKNTYTSYFNINKLEIYYYLDLVSNEENLDVKGISDERLALHAGFFLNILCEVFEAIQTNSVEHCIRLINDIYIKYINKQLPYGYYREFNSDSLFRITFPNNMECLTTIMNPENFKYINMMNNLRIIMELSSIINFIYGK